MPTKECTLMAESKAELEAFLKRVANMILGREGGEDISFFLAGIATVPLVAKYVFFSSELLKPMSSAELLVEVVKGLAPAFVVENLLSIMGLMFFLLYGIKVKIRASEFITVAKLMQWFFGGSVFMGMISAGAC